MLSPTPDLQRELVAAIAAETRREVPREAQVCIAEILRRHGDSIAAILFYGSCLRSGVAAGGVLDFYVLVDDYRAFHGSGSAALLNAMLPPNVYFLDLADDGGRIHAKYAVVSLAQFESRTGRARLRCDFWARFSQPTALPHARDQASRDRVHRALAAAVARMAYETLPLLSPPVDAASLWNRALAESYRTELRAERDGRPDQLFRSAGERYGRLTKILLSHPQVASPGGAGRARRRWLARRIVGRLFHVLRLFKAAFTFRDGLDYILWKIERHSGVRSEPSDWQRRHPLLAAPGLAWRLYRRGAFR